MLNSFVRPAAKSEKKSADEWSPPLVIDEREIPRGRLFVAREDLLPGGTKQRAIVPYLSAMRLRGVREFAYASPFCGFAQVALAVSGRALGIPIALFCEADPAHEGELVPHEFTRVAATFGARVELFPTLAAANAAAVREATLRRSVFNVPLGFNDPLYSSFMGAEVRRLFAGIRGRLGHPPRRLWLPVGSGTLARIFHGIVDPDCRLLCVDVGVLPRTDARIAGLGALPNVQLMREPRLFREKASELPPVPSNVHYDAKLWTWIERFGEDGDVWWNVAR